MSMTLSDDLRQALQTAGTPLRLVDHATGEAFIVLPESAYASVVAAAEFDDDLRIARIPNARLRTIAEHNRPPQAWFESDEEKLFE